MNAALWRARLGYLLCLGGWPAGLGLMLLAGAAVIEGERIPAVSEALAAQRRAVQTLRHEPAGGGPATAATLAAALPGPEALGAAIAAIDRAAAAQGLQTGASEYRTRGEAGGQLLRHEISLPVQGDYPALRAWLAEITAAQPGLVIEELGLHREATETPRLDARLRLLLYVRRAPRPDGAVVPALPTPPLGAAAGNAFPARSWQPPPPLPVEARPTAPPLPFRYAGKLVERGVTRVFLTQGESTALVAAGDRLGAYDVERVTAAAVTLIYRPLQERQTLNFGGYE